MALSFSDIFVAFAGDTTTHDISRASILTKRRRTRTQRRMRRNVVRFSTNVDDDDQSSGSDSDDEKVTMEPQSSFSVAQSSMSVGEDGVGHLDKMASELDALVKFVRRGAESLAGGTSEAASTFGVIAFTLEDWDA
jgi:gamma-tubulin complex component 5